MVTQGSTSTPCLTARLSKETSQSVQLKRAHRSRSLFTVRKKLFFLWQRDSWQRQTDCQSWLISWHSMLKAMWQLNATFANSHSCNWSPWSATHRCRHCLHESRLMDACSSSDQASASLSQNLPFVSQTRAIVHQQKRGKCGCQHWRRVKVSPTSSVELAMQPILPWSIPFHGHCAQTHTSKFGQTPSQIGFTHKL